MFAPSDLEALVSVCWVAVVDLFRYVFDEAVMKLLCIYAKKIVSHPSTRLLRQPHRKRRYSTILLSNTAMRRL